MHVYFTIKCLYFIYTLWWFITPVNMTELKDAQTGGRRLFLAVKVFLEEIST